MASTVRLNIEEVALIARLCMMFQATVVANIDLTPKQIAAIDFITNSFPRLTQAGPSDATLVNQVRAKLATIN